MYFLKRQDSGIFSLIIFALIFRLVLSFLPSFEIDMGAWVAWGERMATLGPNGFYSKEVWTNYLPGYLYILWFFGEIRQLLQIPLNSALYEVLLKLPANLADLGIGFIIYRIAHNYFVKNKAILIASLYLFNPITIFNSAIWGQIDSVLTFFLILSTYFLVEKRNIFISWILFTASFLIKPQAIALLPVFVFWQFLKFGSKKMLIGSLMLVILIFIISLPFFLKNPLLGLPMLFGQMVADYSYTSLFAFNFWWIFGGWKNDTSTNFLIPSQLWSVLFLFFSQILILLWLSKNRSRENYYLAVMISLLSFFVLPTRVHERYLFPFFAFGIVSASIFGRFFWVIWGILTIIHLSNLYFVYTYYNPNYLKIVPLADLIDKGSVFLSAVTVFIFISSIGLLFVRRWLKT